MATRQREHSAFMLVKWATVETLAVALIAGGSAALRLDGFRGLEMIVGMSLAAGAAALPITVVTAVVVGKVLVHPSGLGRILASIALLGIGWTIALESSGPEYRGLGGVILIACGLGGLLSAVAEGLSDGARLTAAIGIGVGAAYLPPFCDYPPKAVWVWAMGVVLPMVATLLAAVPPSELSAVFFEGRPSTAKPLEH